MENQNNRQGSEYNKDDRSSVPNDRTAERNRMDSSEQSSIAEVSDPVIRATIDKFNHEIANEEEHTC